MPVLGGGTLRFASLDHAASTAPFVRVQEAVQSFGSWYANVHRGAGFKSRLSSHAFEEAREEVLAFVGATPSGHVAVFTRNTTESLNHVAHLLDVPRGHVIVTTLMEHHSNDLPWRRIAPVVHVGVDGCGRVDEEELRGVLASHRGRVALLAVSGASNVTGILNPVHRWATWAHEAGALIAVDGAQLVPHRPFEIGEIDFLAFSGHKMHAPFGVGALIGRRRCFDAAPPRLVGGGTVSIVDPERAEFLRAPERDEAGTPCITGAIALAASMREYRRIGWPAIVAHERALASALLRGLGAIDGVTIHGPADPSNVEGRLAVVAFEVAGVPHALVAAILGEEFGIGTRDGCFCAHPYVKALLRVDAGAASALAHRIVAGDHRDVPGLVRASAGLATRMDDVARLAQAVGVIAAGGQRGEYVLDPANGSYDIAGHHPVYADYFQP